MDIKIDGISAEIQTIERDSDSYEIEVKPINPVLKEDFVVLGNRKKRSFNIQESESDDGKLKYVG